MIEGDKKVGRKRGRRRQGRWETRNKRIREDGRTLRSRRRRRREEDDEVGNEKEK